MSMNILVKDPEVPTKTWIVEVPANATIGETVVKFLHRRAGGTGSIARPCLLRLSLGADLLTGPGLMTRTLPDAGVSKGMLLMSSWIVNAGHNQDTCVDCQNLLALLPQADSPRSKLVPSGGGLFPANSIDGGQSPSKQEGKGRKKEARLKSKAKPDSSPTEGPHFGFSEAPAASVEGNAALGLQFLERIITTYIQSTDVVGRLERLIALKSAGHLTAEEFSRAKGKLLD